MRSEDPSRRGLMGRSASEQAFDPLGSDEMYRPIRGYRTAYNELWSRNNADARTTAKHGIAAGLTAAH